MQDSFWQRLGPEALAQRAPLAPGDVWKIRGLSLVYPVVAIILVSTLELSLGRVIGASLFFVAWFTIQFLALSPSRRRQVLGMKPTTSPASSSRPGSPS